MTPLRFSSYMPLYFLVPGNFFRNRLRYLVPPLVALIRLYVLFCFVFFVEFCRVFSYGLRVFPVHVSKSPLIFLDVLVNFVFKLILGSMCCCEQ